MSEHITRAHVAHMHPFNEHLLQVILAPETYLDFEAGQYLQIDATPHPLSYSIANAPNAAHTYELHIRHGRDTPGNERLIHALTQQPYITLSLPHGQCTLNAMHPTQPILFIAGGTGFAPIKAMIEQLINEGQTRPVMLYWNARTADDLYMDEQAHTWAKHAPWFTYYSRLSDKNKASISALVHDHPVPDLKAWQVVLAGPFDMVYALRDELVAYGVPKHQLYADAFAFETQP